MKMMDKKKRRKYSHRFRILIAYEQSFNAEMFADLFIYYPLLIDTQTKQSETDCNGNTLRYEYDGWQRPTDQKKSNGDYSTPIKNLAANGSIIVVGLIYSPLQKYETSKIAKSINITVGKTGRFYEVGHRGAIKSEKALRKLLAKDIAAGYFGQEVIPNAPLIIDQAIKVYRRLMENENEK